MCCFIHLLTPEVTNRTFREGLQDTEWLLDEEEISRDSLSWASNNRALGSQKSQESRYRMGQLVPSSRTRTERKPAARIKSNRKMECNRMLEREYAGPGSQKQTINSYSIATDNYEVSNLEDY